MSQNIEDDRKKWPTPSVDYNVASKDVDSQKIWQPRSDYDAEYGKIHTQTYESGHSVEFDDTKGAERIRVTHANGTFFEMRHDGSAIYRTNGNDFEVIAKDKNLKVKGALNVHIEGDAHVKVGGDIFAESGGNLTAQVGGKAEIKVGGDTILRTPNFRIYGDTVSHNDINIGSSHVHKDVEPGPADTGTPEPL